jgi:hypothetical protein
MLILTDLLQQPERRHNPKDLDLGFWPSLEGMTITWDQMGLFRIDRGPRSLKGKTVYLKTYLPPTNSRHPAVAEPEGPTT